MAHAEDDCAALVQDFKDSVKLKAEQLVQVGIPEKILLLDSISQSLEQYPFRGSNTTANDEPPSLKRVRRENGSELDAVVTVQTRTVISNTNQELMSLIDAAKPHIRQLVEDANTLKMAVTYMIPEMEDGNNFGVSVQEEVLGEIVSVESEAVAFYQEIAQYFCRRGKIVSQLSKYPHVEDYRQAVAEIDDEEHVRLWHVVREVRNCYAALHDVIVKNWGKIIEPRPSNLQSMY